MKSRLTSNARRVETSFQDFSRGLDERILIYEMTTFFIKTYFDKENSLKAFEPIMISILKIEIK
jgi:hypothetical protein